MKFDPSGFTYVIVWAISVLALWVIFCFGPKLMKPLKESPLRLIGNLWKYLLGSRVYPRGDGKKRGYFGQLAFIFLSTLFGLYGFYSFVYTNTPCLMNLWHSLFGFVFPKLNPSLLISIPYLEIGITLYAGGTLLLTLCNKTPFSEWNIYDLQELDYTKKVSPCATAYLATLFFCTYTGTYRVALLCIFALFFTYLKSICFEHDLSKEEVQDRITQIISNRVSSTFENRYKPSNNEKQLLLLENLYDEIAKISNHSISHVLYSDRSTPTHYAQHAQNMYDLFLCLITNLTAPQMWRNVDIDSKEIAFTIGYALLGDANQNNTDAKRLREFYLFLFQKLKKEIDTPIPEIINCAIFGFLLRVCVYEQYFTSLSEIAKYCNANIPDKTDKKQYENNFYCRVYRKFCNCNPFPYEGQWTSLFLISLGNVNEILNIEKVIMKPLGMRKDIQWTIARRSGGTK